MQANERDVTGSIQTTQAADVATEVARLYLRLFPRANALALERACADLARLYERGDDAYWPCDTAYHDIQHVLDVTLAMARLMDGYQRHRGAQAALSAELFMIGTLAALFHDVGYLRRRNDQRHRYGAEYTLTRASRGAMYLRDYVRASGYGERLAQLAGTMLHFTGYERPAPSIRIGAGLPRRMGELLGTADIIAPMSDRCYLEKCRDRLHPEFVLAARAAPRGSALLPALSSGMELVARAPSFFDGAMKRLEKTLDGVYKYAGRHFGGPNLYLEGMRKNVAHAKNPAAPLRRKPPVTLAPGIEPCPPELLA
ncbi:MAG: HD domain-containing protein [Burkholderiales bacterium]